MEFYKLQATGNDFIITFNNSFDFNIKEICKRKYGIGADGFINIDENNNILFFNMDGTKANMCGNGLRCISKLLSIKNNKDENIVYVDNYPINLTQLDENNAKIKLPSMMMIKQDNGYFVNVNNNHYILIVDDAFNYSFSEKDLNILKQKKCNIHAVSIINKTNIKVKSYEYGVGLTNSCGSGSAACFYCLYMLNKVDRFVNIETKGGLLKANENNNNYYLSGPVKLVYKGEYYGCN